MFTIRSILPLGLHRYKRIGAFNLLMLTSFIWEHGLNKLVLMPFLARHLGGADFGSFILAMSVVLFVASVLPAGIFMTNYREHASLDKVARAEFFDTVLAFLFLSGLLFGLLIFLSSEALGGIFRNEAVPRFLPFLAGYLICILCFNFGKQVLAIDLRFKERTAFDIIYGLLLCLVIPAYLIYGAAFVSATYFLASLLGAVAILLYLQRSGSITGFRVVPTKLKSILTSAPSFTLAAGLLTVMTLADRWMVGLFRPESEVTYYYVSVQIAALFVLPFTLLNSVLNAIVSRKCQLTEFSLEESKVFSLAVVASCFTVLVVGLTSGPALISLLYGEEILRFSKVPFQILLLGQAFYVLRIYSQPIVVKFFPPNLAYRLQLVCALTFLAVHLLLVPSYGVVGAAIATSLSFGLLGILFLKNVLLKARDEIARASKVAFSTSA